MVLRRVLSVLLSITLLVSTMGMAAAAVPDTVQAKLASVERDTYGAEQTGAVMERINKLEKEFNGQNNTGSMMARIDALYDQLHTNAGGPSEMAKLNAIEWTVQHSVSMTPLQERISDLEMSLRGKTGEGTLSERISALSEDAFGTNTFPMMEVSVPANTLVKVALADPVNAKNLKVGDKIRYQVADDVVVDGVLLFAKGEPGEGTVMKVQQAQNFGRNAEVNIEFEKTKSIDGTDIDTFVGDKAKEETKSMAMAAGASIAGMVLLGPIGIVAGAFVKGQNIDLPVGTELYIQTKNDEMLYGVQTTLQQ